MNFFRYLASRLRRRGDNHDDYEDENFGQRSIGRTLLDVLLFPIRVLLIPFQAIGNIFKQDELNDPVAQRLGRGAMLL